MATIIIADDHPLILMGLKTTIEKYGNTVIDSCENGIQAYNQIMALKPEIAILDINMNGMTGIEVINKLTENKSKTKCIILTMHNELSVLMKAKAIGAKGYLLKDFALGEIGKCLSEVLNGSEYYSKHLDANISISNNGDINNTTLTASERKIVKLIAAQKATKDIAHLLFISEKTVENHRSNIIKKLNLPKEKNSLLIWALQNKFDE